MLPSVRLASKPRMADFARIVAAVDAMLGTDGLTAYLEKQGALAADSLSADPFIEAIQRIDSFEGTAADLLDRLTPDKPPRSWPTAARVATQRLRRHAPALRRAGFEVCDDGGHNKRKVTVWTIRPEIARNPDPRSPPSPRPLAGQGSPARGDADPVTRLPRESRACNPHKTGVGRLAGMAGDEYGQSQGEGPCRHCDGEGCRHCSDAGRNPETV